ncbi:hypothetical protein RJ640_023183 [Escallonia rubra]|uniref:Uncharacterized protein n=1 Tax=Escallonia rubra TaxID=112253 RepID=A0AA88REA1_9ASTE|nr:hypothetical protein RJ640_023183 [Escallonia rubra]
MDKQAHIPPQANPYGRVDEEVAQSRAEELRRQKIKKYVIYGVIFVVFQVFVLTLMGMTIMKFRNPKFRVRSASFNGTFEVGTPANPSFNIDMNTQFGIKNNNFGPLKYQNTTVDFYYRGTKAQRPTKRAPPPLRPSLSLSLWKLCAALSEASQRKIRCALSEADSLGEEREREGVKMEVITRASIGVLAVAVLIIVVAFPAAVAQSPAPSPVPAPTSDGTLLVSLLFGTAIDQGIAYVLMLVALALTYIIH